MKYKTLFRLLLKFFGVWLIAHGIIEVVGDLLVFAQHVHRRSGFGFIFNNWWGLLAPAKIVVQIGIGMYLFFGGRWIVNLAIPSNRPYCHECGYELTRTDGNACPECGTAFR